MDIAIYCGEVNKWVNLCERLGPTSEITRLDYNTIATWLSSKRGGTLIFGTDIMPYTAYNYPRQPISDTPLFRFMNDGGIVIWVGEAPFYQVHRGKILATGTNPFPFVPFKAASTSKLNLSTRFTTVTPLESITFNDMENSLVGHLLEYKPVESLRPIESHPEVIPISFRYDPTTKVYYYSAWIYKVGKGLFVRVYDSMYVDLQYVLSLPEKLRSMREGVRIRNYRKLNDILVKIPRFKMLIIVGDNNVGKTTLIEALALLNPRNEENLQKIKQFRDVREKEELPITKDTLIEAYMDGKYYLRHGDVFVTGNALNSRIVFPCVDKDVESDESVYEKLSGIVSRLDSNVYFLFKSQDGKTKVLFADKTLRNVSDLGTGYRTLIGLLSNLAGSPDILLIDDLESFALHPVLLKKVVRYLLEANVRAIITTQSMDVIYYSAGVLLEKIEEQEEIKEAKSNLTKPHVSEFTDKLLSAKKASKTDVMFMLFKGDSYELMDSEEVYNIIPYEDIRYLALQKEETSRHKREGKAP